MKNLYIIGISLLLVIACCPVQAQSDGKKIVITGNVIDQSGRPVVGVHMIVDEIMLENTTGLRGQYRIKVLPTTLRIGISVQGLYAVEQLVNGRKKIQIVITDSIHEIIAAQVKTKVKSDPSDDYANYTTIYDLIRAKLPGVEVNGTSMLIRGPKSILSDTEPLLVVDGMVVNSISYISPIEVATLEVLKGPDASIYGSRGANGVILITLKRGKKQP